MKFCFFKERKKIFIDICGKEDNLFVGNILTMFNLNKLLKSFRMYKKSEFNFYIEF